MCDELDFNDGKLSWHSHPGNANLAATRRVLTVIAMMGLAVACLAVIVEHRFWWLTLTGQRATAQITGRDERVIAWISSRRMALSGQAFPLIETEFQFAFTDHVGAERQGTFTLPEASQAFRVGEKLDVMYPRFGNGRAEPSGWGYYFRHDAAWFSFTSVGLGCLLLSAVCLEWRRRLPGG